MSCAIPYTIRQGEARKPRYTAFTEDGEIQNLSGALIEMQVKPQPGDPDSELLINKVSPLGIIILDQTVGGDTEGQFEVCLDPQDTAGIAPGYYFYDIVLILPGFDRSYGVLPSPFVIASVVNQF